MPNNECNEFFDKYFDLTELNLALDSRNSKSAPGMDGINYEVLKNLPLKYKLILLDIYNQLYATNEYPLEWKHSYIYFIKKSEGKNVRPIALSSSICKLFETLVKNRLQYSLEYNNLLPVSQTGFRKGQSCVDNLVNLSLCADEGLANKKDTIAVFLDVQGAFDNVNSDILIKKLASTCGSNHLTTLVKFLTYQRIIHLDILGNETRMVHKGVPQGGVLSPLLYVLYVSDITNKLSKHISVSQFADDIAIYSNISPFKKCKNLIEKSLVIIKNNLLSLGLELSPQKTKLLHFNNKQINPGQTEIKIDEHIIKSSDSARFLGITYDYKMSFAPHLFNVKKKCMKALNIIKYLCGTWWGSDPETLINLYKNFVRSHIDYGCFVYFPTRANLREQLEKIQYSAIRSALGYRNSTPTNILLAESKLPGIRDRAEFLCNSYLSKVLSNTGTQVNKTIHRYHFKNRKNRHKRKTLIRSCIEGIMSIKQNLHISDHYDIYRLDYNTIITSIPINSYIGKLLKSKNNNPNTVLSNLVSEHESYTIYTDGSKISGANSVGSACICPELNISIKRSIPKTCSVFTAECIAPKDALEIALLHAEHNYKIFTDSLSVLLSIQNPRIDVNTNLYIYEIKRKYKDFEYKSVNNSSIEIFWIPSHIGIQGNEEADALAKIATEAECDETIHIPFTDLRESFKHNCSLSTKKFIEQQGQIKGKDYFRFYYKSSNKPWFANVGLSREIIVTINRGRSDHYNLASSLQRVHIISDAKCNCNYGIQDLNHIVWQCPLLDNQRTELIEKLKKCKLRLALDIRLILSKPNIEACTHVCQFLKKCNLKI